MDFIFQDNRTEEQKETHQDFIVARDTFLSGWGNAPRTSYAMWACDSTSGSDTGSTYRWVQSRSDMRDTHALLGNDDLKEFIDRVSMPGNHVHIYLVHANHPAALFEVQS